MQLSILEEYFLQASDRLPEEAQRVLSVLLNDGNMNKEELSLTSQVKRAVLDHVVMQLYALGFVEVSTEGKSKICGFTRLGEEYFNLLKQAG